LPAGPGHPAGKGELRALTSLRGIAAIAVVMYHFEIYFRHSFYLAGATLLINQGFLWVDFFFLLSGFILCYVHADEFDDGLKAYGGFLVKRIARVYPLHILTLVLLLLPVFLHVEHAPVLSFAANVLLVQAWSFSNKLLDYSWNYPSWSISAEWASYLLFPVVLAVFYRPSFWKSASVLSASGLALYWLAHTANSDFANSLGMATVEGILLFSTGVVIYRLFKLRPAVMSSDAVFAAFAALVLIAMHFGFKGPVIVFPMCGLLLAAALNEGTAKWLLSKGPLHYLGTISYSIYMLHALLQFALLEKPWFQDFLRQISSVEGFLLYSMACLSVICAASFSYHFIEVPGRNLVRKLFWPVQPMEAKFRGAA
jgi:peptidoglycan/LPS O-acetylase OafA/YrhL